MKQRYRHGHFEVEAVQHDGSNDSAHAIAAWVRSEKGEIDVIVQGDFEYDPSHAFLRLHDRFDRLVQPNFWVVRVHPGMFYSVYPDVFKNLYTLIEEESLDHAEATPSLR